jgi:hypothetical protein
VRSYYLVFVFTSVHFAFCSDDSREAPGSLTFDSAVEYNEFIIGRQRMIANQIAAVAQTMGSDGDTTDLMLANGVCMVDSALADLKKLPPFRGDTLFRKSAQASVLFYRRLFASDYPHVLQLQRGGPETRAKRDSIRQKIRTEEAALDEQLRLAQDDFARKQNMPLLQNSAARRE